MVLKKLTYEETNTLAVTIMGADVGGIRVENGRVVPSRCPAPRNAVYIQMDMPMIWRTGRVPCAWNPTDLASGMELKQRFIENYPDMRLQLEIYGAKMRGAIYDYAVEDACDLVELKVLGYTPEQELLMVCRLILAVIE